MDNKSMTSKLIWMAISFGIKNNLPLIKKLIYLEIMLKKILFVVCPQGSELL